VNVLNTSTNATIETSNTNAATSASPTPVAGVGAGEARVAIDFLTRSNNADLIAAVQRILAAMTGNANYPTPVPALADIAAARTSFDAAVSSDVKSAHAIVVRKQLRTQLVGLMRSLAFYVQQTSNGDPAILATSGYPARRTRQPAGVLSAPANLRLARGKISGQLKARCNGVARAGSYQWRYATAAAPTTWTLVDPTLGASTVLEGLVAGTVYAVQVRAVGSQGPSDWSDVANLMAV
jgi:hypothetical protein